MSKVSITYIKCDICSKEINEKEFNLVCISMRDANKTTDPYWPTDVSLDCCYSCFNEKFKKLGEEIKKLKADMKKNN